MWEQIGKDRVVAVAAGVTFYGLLAIFPLIAAIVSIYGFVADPATINEHLRAMSSVLPGGALEVVGEQVTRIASQPRGQLGFGFIAGLAVTLWSANAGMKAIFDALNVAYGEEEKRSFFRLNLQSMTFTILAIVAAIAAMLAVVVLPPALEFLGLGDALQSLISIARWPLLLLGLGVALAVLYRYGPSRDEPRWSWISPGAIVAALVWLLASLAFSLLRAELRLLQRDLRVARRRHRLHDVDVDLRDHRARRRRDQRGSRTSDRGGHDQGAGEAHGAARRGGRRRSGAVVVVSMAGRAQVCSLAQPSPEQSA